MTPEMTITVICPTHGEHDAAIVSTFPGSEGVWCQICWIESLGPSLPYRKRDEGHQTMAQANPQEEGWTSPPKNTPME